MGLSLGLGGRAFAGTGTGVAATQVAPSVAAYGTGTQAVSMGSKWNAGKSAAAAGTVAIGSLGLLWYLHPAGERNRFGTQIFAFGLAFLAFSQVGLWGAVHVAEGDTSGFMGHVYKGAALF